MKQAELHELKLEAATEEFREAAVGEFFSKIRARWNAMTT